MPQSIRVGTCSKPPQEQGDLLQSKNRECSWNNPTNRVREPWPAILLGVETDVAISSAKLPFPEPVRFLAGTVQQPVDPLHSGGYCRHHITKSHYSHGSDPATLLIVPGKDWPTSIRVLRDEEKVLGTFDVAHGRRAKCERGVARRLNGWLRG